MISFAGAYPDAHFFKICNFSLGFFSNFPGETNSVVSLAKKISREGCETQGMTTWQPARMFGKALSY
jgi:hypothetical protein